MEKTRKKLAWQLTTVRNKKEVIVEARDVGRKVHFASLMDICHLKNSDLEPKFQKYKGRVVLRGDIVKDDSGAYAVFTEQGSSASQMTAAKVMDIVSRLPGCSGQAADAVYPLPGQSGRCTDVIENSESSTEDPVVPLERNLYGPSLAGLYWERQFERVPLEHVCEQVPNWDCFFGNREKDYSCLYVDDT